MTEPESFNPESFNKATHRRGALLTTLVCGVWVFLSARNPTLHYHFAPLIGGLVWPLSLRTQGVRPLADAVRGGAGAAVLTLAVTVGILVAGNMEGPNFLHEGPAWPEAVLFALVGALLGARAASRERPGFLGRIVESVDRDTVANNSSS